MAISFSSPTGRDPRARGAGVTAVLGPTNTGKTHLAIERMVAIRPASSACRCGCSRARSTTRSSTAVGAEAVALITGEEKIKPQNPRYWVSTVEAMPRDLDVAFLAVDEVQLGADLDRGHVFTDRMLNRRGRDETLLLGAATMRPMVEKLLPGAHVSAAAHVAADLRGREEDHAPAAPLRHRRLLGGGSLRHRRTDPPPARRRRGGAGRAVAAHAQRAGGALSIGRRRLSGRHRRHRHGPQSRRRSRRLCLRPEIRRLPVPPAQSRRTRAGRRPRRPRHARRHLRHHRPLPSLSSRNWCRRWRATASSRCGCCSGATPISISPRSPHCRSRSR